MADVGAGDDEAIGMDGIGGIGHQDRIAGPDGRQCEVRETFLRANGHDDLVLWIELHVVAALVPIGHRPAQAGDAARLGIAMGVLALHCLNQFVDNVLRRGLVGIAHAEVDDILASGACGVFQFRHDGENIGRQPLDTGKIFDHGGSGPSGARPLGQRRICKMIKRKARVLPCQSFRMIARSSP